MFKCIKLTRIEVWGETPSKTRVDNFFDAHMSLNIVWIIIFAMPSPKLKVFLASLTPFFHNTFESI